MSDAMRRLLNALDLGRRAHEAEGLRPARDHPVDDVDLLERRAHGFAALHRRGHVHGPELSADATLA
jgi:hypothetical protein